MKRAMLMAILAMSLTTGSVGAHAYPNGPCIQPAAQNAPNGSSQVQLFMLLLPALVSPMV